MVGNRLSAESVCEAAEDVFTAFVCEGKEEGYRQEFHHGGEDGRMLADDRFLEQVVDKRVPFSLMVSL